jgi:DNA-binding NtrC family response regulator
MSRDNDVDTSPIAKTLQTRCHAASSSAEAQSSMAVGSRATTVEPPAQSVGERSGALDFETHSWAMRPVFAAAAKAASRTSMVLITGEAGVGKEWLARWVHAHSARANRPFVLFDWGAFDHRPFDSYLPEDWGGAFTPITGEIFDDAAGGTLFIDEISVVPRSMQWTPVQVLEAQVKHGVRDVLPARMDVRLIAATRRNLRHEMTQRWFRSDLYYSLPEGLYMPPLRERPADLWILAHALLARAVTRRHRAIGGFAPQAMAHLLSYDWPRNVRELEEAVEHACVVAAGSEIQGTDLPDLVQRGGGSTRPEGPNPLSRCPIARATGPDVD